MNRAVDVIIIKFIYWRYDV